MSGTKRKNPEPAANGAAAPNASAHRFALHVPIKLGVIFLARKRGGFMPEWGEEMRRKVLEVLGTTNYVVHVPEVPPIVDDKSLRVGVAECKASLCDALVVLQTTISDGRLAPILAQAWDAPVILWATPEKQDCAMISANSLVGTHVFGASLRQLGHPFEVVFGNTDWDLALRQLDRAVHVIVAQTRLRNVKMGLIGYHAPGFIDLHPDLGLMNKTFRAQMQHVGLQEFLELCNSFDAKVVAADVKKLQALKLPMDEVTPDELDLASRAYLALRHLSDQENFDAMAIRCWPELPNGFGQWVYLVVARMVSEGYPMTIEGDIDGCINYLIAKFMDMGAIYLSDWLEHDNDTVTIWHGGMAPFQLCEDVGAEHGPTIARHFNNKKACVVEATIKAGMPVTVFRMWACDHQYHMMALNGKTVKPTRHLMGNNGAVQFEGVNLFELFDDMIHKGMPHHVLVVEGHHRDALKAFCRRAGINMAN